MTTTATVTNTITITITVQITITLIIINTITILTLYALLRVAQKGIRKIAMKTFMHLNTYTHT
jgi:hypothetical protein